MKLPNFLCPKYKCELIRLGQKNDGGYSIPKKSLKNSKIILGFGLSDDWSFGVCLCRTIFPHCHRSGPRVSIAGQSAT